jgi:hypothetical protein
MEKSCLHNCLYPLVKNSSQRKHLPSLQHYTISTGDGRMVLVAVLLTNAEGAAGPDADEADAGNDAALEE